MFYKVALLTAVMLAQFTPITALAAGSCPRGFHNAQFLHRTAL